MIVQQRNDGVAKNMTAEFQRRYEPNFAFCNAVSLFQLLPQLRGFWPMSSFNESNSCIDMSCQGRNLTDGGTVTKGYNPLCPYAIFSSGGSQRLYRNDENGLDITGKLTFGGWFYQTAVTSKYFLGKFGAAGQRAYILANTSSADYRLYISSDGTATVNVISTITPAINTWCFIVGRYNPSTEIAIFINETKTINTTSIPGAIFNSNAAFMIGGASAAIDYFDGYATLCFLCADNLSDTMISTIYQQTRALFSV